ncbi:MAG: hypothetical protein IT370_35610 [Deltaproteobacteria bacterium]|nr:hypothetical protein [Deltaproteobacteria bacterium]
MLAAGLATTGMGCKGGGGGGSGGARTRESTVVLKRLYQGAKQYFTENGAVPTTPGPLTPAATACNGGAQVKHAPDAALWAGSPWVELNFTMDDPHYYSYQYEGSVSGITLTAVGDLDCDGTPSTFTLKAQIDSGQLSAPTIIEDRPNE